MIRTINTKFFTFVQNNSGGYFYENAEVAHYLIIEAQNVDEAISKMETITENWSNYCSCCGERWSCWMDERDGKEEPMVYDRKAKEPSTNYYDKGTVIIYYYDGTKEKLRYPTEESEE